MTGHAFVVPGRMEIMPWDCAIVPTDSDFNIEHSNWSGVLGDVHVDSLRPTRWREQQPFGRAATRDDIWFLDVTAPHTRHPDELMRDLLATLEDIAARMPSPRRGRVKPLIALPVLGIGAGGLRTDSGDIIRRLLETTISFTRERDLDVVVVASRRSAYAALQAQRRRTGDFAPLDGRLLSQARTLGGYAREGRLALLIGGGVSIPAGGPSWRQLVEEMRTHAEDAAVRDGEAFGQLAALEQAELLQRELRGTLTELVADRMRQLDKPAISHVLLAALGCREVVTTNYDRCFEAAVSGQDGDISVMPWEEPTPDLPWLLKLHGDLEHHESIVLTRGQFVGYDARWRPAASLFQAVLLTRHLMVVGASLTDDNILRLAHETTEFRRAHGVTTRFGSVLALDEEPLKSRLWRDELDWIGMGGETEEEQARHLEIFLDALATHACRDASFLLDPDFRSLLSEPEQQLADVAGSMALRATSFEQDGWGDLVSALRALGAREEAGTGGDGSRAAGDGKEPRQPGPQP
ncbi:SIR2 family protein [Ornithinicoccus halotolerans]|uniref:SIR2 family protein n=1 Tax=Ornithinicoccus halotolerans TaxID=1748220 RepID=UPI0012961E1C|nr:SIR2 family protein [Ornithinicoccus halotolerans]